MWLYSSSDTHSDSNTFWNADTDPHGYADAYSNSRCDANSHPHAKSISKSFAYTSRLIADLSPKSASGISANMQMYD